MPNDPILDVWFPLVGSSLPTDHGYALFTAVTDIVPELHVRTDYGIHPVSGRPLPGRRLALTRTSHLIFRAPASLLQVLVPLTGSSLEAAGQRVQVGAPHVSVLGPNPVLRSRLVVIKGAMEPDTFIVALSRRLDELGVTGQPSLPPRGAGGPFEGRTAGRSGPIRRTLRIRDKEVVGYSAVVSGLAPQDSIRLQERGLGGRRRFGCGVMVPAR